MNKAGKTKPDPLLTQDTGWISVNDRLPSEDMNCIVGGYLLDDYGKQIPTTDIAVYFADDGWQIGSEWIHEVTHWMPLPLPPKNNYQKTQDA